ncbi:MAG: hypothetical protein J5845_02400 [Lachnospiraceae bacterium]|nr:hypothetical protein [Lachnospiraceae bacterium]
MKIRINKRVLKDALRRTRGLRIFSVILAIASFAALDLWDGCWFEPVTTSILPMGAPVIVVLVMLTFEDMAIHRYHRSRKWEFYWALPVSRKERFDATFSAQVINLIIYAVFEEAAQIGLGRFLLWIFGEERTPIYWSEHLHRLRLLLVIGLFFIAFLAIVRELTHTFLSYAALLIGTVGLNYVIFLLLPTYVRAFSSNVVAVEGSFLYRLRLVYRVMQAYKENGEEILFVAYDWLPQLIMFILAVGMFFTARKLAAGFRTEHVEAEYRNRPLFGILMIILNMFPFTLLLYGTLSRICFRSSDIGEITISILLSPVYIVLIMVLLCMTLHVKPGRKLIIPAIAAPLLTLLICGGAFLYGSAAKTLPDQDEIIAVHMYRKNYFGKYLYTDEAVISQYYERIRDELENPDWGRNTEFDEEILTVYTKNGSRKYAIGLTALQREEVEFFEVASNKYIIHAPIKQEAVVCCGYGTEPLLMTDFSTDGEYEHFLSLIPENEKRKVDCYYVNVLGGLSKCKEPLLICDLGSSADKLAGDRFDVMDNAYVRNAIPSDSSYIPSSFRFDSEAMRYYYEKVILTQRERAFKNAGNARGNFENGGYHVSIRVYRNAEIYQFTLKMQNGKPVVTASPAVFYSEEESRHFYELVFSENLDFHKEQSRVSVYLDVSDFEDWLDDYRARGNTSFTQYIPSEELAPYCDAVDLKNQQLQEQWDENQKFKEGGQTE